MYVCMRLLLIEARLPHTARCIGAAALAHGYHLKARIPRSNPFVGLAILTRRDGGGPCEDRTSHAELGRVWQPHAGRNARGALRPPRV